MAKRKISSATRERLRRMREKYHLGEYKVRSASKPARGGNIYAEYKRSVESKMARRYRRSSRRSGSFGFGGGGMVKKAAMGAAAGILLGGILGIGAGFLVGGIPGAAGAYFAPQIKSAIQGVTGGSGTQMVGYSSGGLQ